MLRGKLIELVPNEERHLPNYVRWFADTEVEKYFGTYRPINLAQERQWLEGSNHSSDTINFAVEFKDEHVGGAGFQRIHYQHQNAEVGLFIGERRYWDRGFGQDILATMLDYGFNILNFHRVYLRVHENNFRAVHAYEKVGFRHEGTFREHEWRHGQWQNLLYMAVLRAEWGERDGEEGGS